MKAISLYGEHWDEIESGEKTEEYRSWSTSYRGDIFICYTGTKEAPGATSIVAELYDCVPTENNMYAFKLRNVRYFRPFTVIGKQRIFDIDVNLEDLEFFDPNTDEGVDGYYKAFDEYVKEVNAQYAKKKGASKGAAKKKPA